MREIPSSMHLTLVSLSEWPEELITQEGNQASKRPERGFPQQSRAGPQEASGPGATVGEFRQEVKSESLSSLHHVGVPLRVT